MVAHLGTTIIRPTWCQGDAEVTPAERLKRLKLFRVCTLQEVERDCTQIVEFCDVWRTQELYREMAESWEQFCTEVLSVSPAWVDRLCAGLRLLRADGHVGAVPAQEAEARALREHGGDRRSEAFQAYHDKLEKKHGTSQDYLKARLQRDRPDLLEAYARQEFPSLRAAAKAAGFVKDESPLMIVARLWRKVPEDELLTFLQKTLTPAQWRTLQHMMRSKEPTHDTP
jgi:hypothetical protein